MYTKVVYSPPDPSRNPYSDSERTVTSTGFISSPIPNESTPIAGATGVSNVNWTRFGQPLPENHLDEG